MSNKYAVDLVNNQKTMRNAMGEQLNMVGASYIGVSSFLVNATEIAAGSRFDNLLDIGNAGLKTVLETLYKQVTNRKLDKAGDKSVRETAAKQILYIQSALLDTKPPEFTEPYEALSRVERGLNNVDGIKSLDKMLSFIRQGDPNLTTDVRELERKLYTSYILTGRQGAPAGSGAGYAEGRTRTSVNNIAFRAEDAYSGFKLDVEGNSTALILSTLGNQFTELGDYDGDSFQAAVTRMAEISAEIKKTWDELDKVKGLRDSLLDRISTEGLNPAEKEQADRTNEVIDASSNALNRQYLSAKKDAERIAESLADKVRAMAELHKQSTEIGMKRVS